MAKWKYRIHEVTLGDRNIVDIAERDLNEAGQRGWEAVAWIPNPSNPKLGWLLLKSQA